VLQQCPVTGNRAAAYDVGPRVRQVLLIAVGAALVISCSSGGASTATNASQPPIDHWVGPDGQSVPNGRTLVGSEYPLTIDLKAGPDHCGLQSVQFLDVVFPLGGVVMRYTSDVRQYVWDPDNTQQFRLEATAVRRVALPPDAKDTGYRYGALRLWTADSDSAQQIYLEQPDGSFDRWPRSITPILCS